MDVLVFELLSLGDAIDQNSEVGKRNYASRESNTFSFGLADFSYYQGTQLTTIKTLRRLEHMSPDLKEWSEQEK